MRTDGYTKIILTVIAASLLWINLKDIEIISNAFASEVVQVRIVSMELPNYKPIPVKIMGRISCE